MASASTYDAVSRQWEILKILPTRTPGLTSNEIHKELILRGYRTSRRTLERDLKELHARFTGLSCNDKGRPYGWYKTPGLGEELHELSLADALSTRLVEELLRPLLPGGILRPLEERFGSARRKLDGLGGRNPLAAWARKVRYVQPTLSLQPPSLDEAALATVQDALLRDESVRVCYARPGDAEARELLLHPHALVQRGQTGYLLATAFGYDDLRLYALHRLHSATATHEPVRRQPKFDLDDYLRHNPLEFGSAERIRLVLWVDDDLAAILRETPLAPGQTLSEAPGGHRLEADVAYTWQLQWWLQSQGARLEVLAPAVLRQAVGNEVLALAEKYRHDSPAPSAASVAN
ncbi:helix-turn-helix transcriptional regulator [Amphibiibacter pelophylacis]|uniref:WYL domain-containing protein n=1 Tax=Amphibiibacter pelophylacis TaxID=1799477 RepID=A0ACC6NY27_9BURK